MHMRKNSGSKYKTSETKPYISHFEKGRLPYDYAGFTHE